MSMHHDNDNPARDFTDAEVSAAYRGAARETSPPGLDREILREAAQETKSGARSAWGNGWLRPLTFVATLGLTIALLLELSEYQLFDPPIDMEMNNITIAPAAVPESSDADDTPPTRIEQERDAFAIREAVDATASQLQAIDETANARLQEVPNAEPAAKSAIPAAAAVASDMAARRQPCTDEQRVNPEEWWLCISELRRVGLQDAAELELQKLRDAFPQFSPQ